MTLNTLYVFSSVSDYCERKSKRKPTESPAYTLRSMSMYLLVNKCHFIDEETAVKDSLQLELLARHLKGDYYRHILISRILQTSREMCINLLLEQHRRVFYFRTLHKCSLIQYLKVYFVFNTKSRFFPFIKLFYLFIFCT